MNHQRAMQRALDLAKKGKGCVAPNPLVGCVIVHDGEIVAEGYHLKFGEAHAEVNAINAMPLQLLTANCTLYVSLEPCSHFGKTPPCADLIISKGFKKVIVAIHDPNPKVSGSGIQKLREAGIEVIVGVLEAEAKALNKAFFTFHKKQRPHIILKWAQTADGFISRIPVPKNNSENKISGAEAHQMVHALRSEVLGIMVGKNTVLSDNPHLTTRLVEGENPIRIVIDKNLDISSTYNVFSNEAKTIVFNGHKDELNENITRIKLNFEKEILSQMLAKLYQLHIQSILIEGGSILLQSFIDANLWDESYIFENPDLKYGQGLKAPVFERGDDFKMLGNDRLFYLKGSF
ncbi:MAG: bifunctional diaminohydroxyphosphoribosylaminopyrimidine deaminase/5-amino-6-(5-phosphoribosylamino)uracil reductase RibD [Bacteroidota bacterium]